MHNISRPKAVIFDLDDTLITTSASRRIAWHSVISSFVSRLGGRKPTEVVDVIVDSDIAYWIKPEPLNGRSARVEIVRRGFSALRMEDQPLELEIVDAFMNCRLQELKCFPEAISTLHKLRSDGVRLALLTNSGAGVEPQKHKIELFNLAVYFDYIQIESEVGVGKPEPAAFRRVLAKLELPAEDVWMVGDNLEFDVGGAQNVGIRGIWHDYEGNGLPDEHPIRPDHTITAVSEVLTLAGIKLQMI